MRLYRVLLRRVRLASRERMAKEGREKVDELQLYNSLTRKKEKFIALSPPTVTWYSCGPTVYDSAHMGHARSYITFDILRRVMSDYFGYHVNYVMNITDIDDKIIRRARRNYLLENYSRAEPSLSTVVSDIHTAMKSFTEKARSEQDNDKQRMLLGIVDKVKTALEEATIARENGENTHVSKLLSVSGDPLSDWLDGRLGSTVTDKSIFAALTQQYEEEFHRDMEALNVLPADVLTRVSEYVPEVVDYIQHIIDRGYGYESNGSVYFDVMKFSSSPDHHYAKLVPEAVGDLSALAEGEGELITKDKSEKRAASDFALWKASKSGEPAWPSPWGNGRPGWHIECSVMACDILGESADIHTGGVDLKFPHHDNEIAQAEARYGSDRWMTYFLHSGHLTISGCKMSKSLKNFITIKQALEKHTAQQLRLSFLLHSWSSTLDYGDTTMAQALSFEKIFNDFFLTVKDLLRKQPTGVQSYTKFTEREKLLLTQFTEIRAAVHSALCDNVDTPQTMKLMRELVNYSYVYLADKTSGQPPNARLLGNIASYMTGMFRMYGVIPSHSSSSSSIGFPLAQAQQNQEEMILPYLSIIADFRTEVRMRALEVKDVGLLKACDVVRDERLGDLGVKLEDKEVETVVKVVGREAIQREREMERQAREEKEKVKAEQKRKLEEAKRQREAQAAIPPDQMFLSETDKYSKFDEKGIPTHDVKGENLSDKQRKKLMKLWEAQEKKYQDHCSKQQQQQQQS